MTQITYPRYTIRGLIHGTEILLRSITSSFGGRFFTKEGNFLLNNLIVVQNTLYKIREFGSRFLLTFLDV
jgi:hypothetical protein